MAMMMNSPPDDPPQVSERQQTFTHFSHRHPLQLTQVHSDDHAVCSGCENDIPAGPTYICTKPKCTFLLHDLCLDLPRRIRHRGHRSHPLGLLFPPPYADREFTCDACGESGHGFTYHCGTCKFDLHVGCASLPETEDRADHRHPLILVCDFWEKIMEGGDVVCYLCDGPMGNSGWVYACLGCKCAAHLECAGTSSDT